MPTRIASVAGVHPLFLGTDTPIGVDASGTKWGISFQGRNAILLATFATGATLQFTIPTTSTAGAKSGSVASFSIPNFGDARWTTYQESVKFEVTFPVAPKVTSVSVNIARQNTDLVSDGNGGLNVMSAGVKVGALPRPFIDYLPDGKQDRTRVWLDWVVADPSMTLTLPTLSASEWATAVLDPTVITTSTASTATAYSNQRKIDRCQNGVLWTMYWNGNSDTTGAMHFSYSTDNGATWTDGGGFGFTSTGTTYTPNGSLFIDLDDYAHVVYKDRSDGIIYYRRGTPNAGRTAYTWSAATSLVNTLTTADYPDLVACRTPGVSEWDVFAVFSYNSGTINYPGYRRVHVAAGGGVTLSQDGLSGTNFGGLASSYGVAANVYPSIDFNHTGDGKTVAGGTPHLYAAWSAGTTGAGKGIRFKKATYSGGTWTWGTEVEIDNTIYTYPNSALGAMVCLFDGTRVVIAGQAYTGSVVTQRSYDRDAADTTTTPGLVHDAATVDDRLSQGSVSYDKSGNLYLFGMGEGTTKVLQYRKWNRSTGTLDPLVSIDNTSMANAWVSAKRGYSGGKIEYVYTDGSASPFSVTYGNISLGISIAINPALETDSNQPFGKRKRKTLGIAASTDVAQALGRIKRKSLLPATETDLAMVIGQGIRVALAPATETDLAMPITVTMVPHPYVFTPPVHDEPMPTLVKPFRYFVQPVSFAVVKRNGHFQSVRVPSQDETDALVEGVTWFTGGRTYEVSGSTVADLIADGFSVTPL